MPRRQSRDTISDLPLLPGRRGMVVPGGTLPVMAGGYSPLHALKEATRVASLGGRRNEVAATAGRHLRSDPHSAEKELGGTSQGMPAHLRREAPLTTAADVADILGVTLNRGSEKSAGRRGQESP